MSASITQLRHLAALYGIKTSYLDMNDVLRPASAEALLAVLKAMGAPLSGMADVPSAIREKLQQYWKGPLEPVIVLWENQVPAIGLRLPASLVGSVLMASLRLENGEDRDFSWNGGDVRPDSSADIEGTQYVALSLALPETLPLGYHRLKLDLPGRTAEALVISAPLKAYCPPEEDKKIWGAFLPLYALHSHRSWGAGDFGDLEAFMAWVADLGGNLAGTLPLLPSFFDEKAGPGPYLPASRLFWNEFYLDIDGVPELPVCPSARELMVSPAFQNEFSLLSAARTVDYRRQLSLKRQVLEELSECFFAGGPDRNPDFLHFVRSQPQVEDYARFRAAGEQCGIEWRSWPSRMRDGELKTGDFREKARQYYLYTQWLAHGQIQKLFHSSEQADLFLYLDLPVGVHPCSYDIWSERDSFVPGVCGGAPPDPVFTSGQNWSFPPLHPEKVREEGYRYFIRSIRHHLRQARMLRIDHMMGFHRLFWIPEGMENREGLYAGYRSEELYAILTLESCRHRSVIIGEDLGMVPPEVRPAMDKHGIYRMYVGQFDLISEGRMGKIPSHSIASLNTHDMFPFASFWREKDIPERLKLQLVTPDQARKELEQRRLIKRTLIDILQSRGLNSVISKDDGEALKAILRLLAASPAYALMINLEDLWLETRPQNIPGTLRSRNWSRKARFSFEEFSRLPRVLDILREMDRARKTAGS